LTDEIIRAVYRFMRLKEKRDTKDVYIQKNLMYGIDKHLYLTTSKSMKEV